MSKHWYTYIATNYPNSVLYVGISNDIPHRLWQHKNKQDKDSFTARYNVYKCVWFAEFDNPTEAIAMEKRIKGWTRARKVKLIEEKNPHWKDLLK